jgi:hypothetical protein
MFAFFISAALLSVATATDVQNQLETARLPQATQRLEFGAEAFKFSFADLAKVRLIAVIHECLGASSALRDASSCGASSGSVETPTSRYATKRATGVTRPGTSRAMVPC